MKAPHRAQHHVHHHHAVGKTPGPPKGVNPGGPMVTGGKGTATGKHHSHNHHKHQPKKPRKWTPDGDVALCSARAVAESARLTLGLVLCDADVLSLYCATASDPDEGQSLTDALSAAQEHYPLRFEPVCPCEPRAVILGLDLPGGEPHAVAVGPDGTWWSWGQPFDPAQWPGLAVEEAWAVTW